METNTAAVQSTMAEERIFSRLKEELAIKDIRVRSQWRVTVYIAISLMSMMAVALAAVESGRKRQASTPSGSRHQWELTMGYNPRNFSTATSIVKQYLNAGVSVFVKQDSGMRPGRQGRIPDSLWRLKGYP